jgi:hypothetical protein
MYRIEISAFADYDGLDRKPTKEELHEWIYQFICDLDKGYIIPDIGIYEEEDEET